MSASGAGELEGRGVLVTGGGSGIGRASALAMASRGARVCVADVAAEGAASVAKEIREAGGEAFDFAMDVRDPAQNAAMVAAASERWGRLQAAHLNAGIAASSPLLDCTLEDWQRVLDVNLSGVFLGLQAVARNMAASGGGSIVVTASVAGLSGGPGMIPYYASKHGVVGLVRSAASELAGSGIRVNAVCPGVIDTPMLGAAHGVPEITDGLLGQAHLLGRSGRPQEVAEVVVFLAGDRSSFVTGVAWPVDGGMTATPSSVGGPLSEESLGEVIAGVGNDDAE